MNRYKTNLSDFLNLQHRGVHFDGPSLDGPGHATPPHGFLQIRVLFLACRSKSTHLRGLEHPVQRLHTSQTPFSAIHICVAKTIRSIIQLYNYKGVI